MDGLILLAVLVCPIVMGTMMLLMWRAMRGHGDGGSARDEVGAATTMTGDRGEEAGR